MFCARCGRDLGKKQECEQCGWSVHNIDMSLGLPSHARASNGYAVASLVCGITSVYLCGGGFVIPAVGLVLGILGMKSDQPGIATMGIILNIVILLLPILLVLLSVMIWMMGQTNAVPVVPPGRCC